MPVDNLSVNENGHIFAAKFLKMLDIVAFLEIPYDINPPSPIFRIRKVVVGVGKEYKVKTTALHNV